MTDQEAIVELIRGFQAIHDPGITHQVAGFFMPSGYAELYWDGPQFQLVAYVSLPRPHSISRVYGSVEIAVTAFLKAIERIPRAQ